LFVGFFFLLKSTAISDACWFGKSRQIGARHTNKSGQLELLFVKLNSEKKKRNLDRKKISRHMHIAHISAWLAFIFATRMNTKNLTPSGVFRWCHKKSHSFDCTSSARVFFFRMGVCVINSNKTATATAAQTLSQNTIRVWKIICEKFHLIFPKYVQHVGRLAANRPQFRSKVQGHPRGFATHFPISIFRFIPSRKFHYNIVANKKFSMSFEKWIMVMSENNKNFQIFFFLSSSRGCAKIHDM
jgi:hypothetical protein